MRIFYLKLRKMSEMQKVSEVFKSNLNYYQRVAHKNVLLDFQVSIFLSGGPAWRSTFYSRNSLIELTKIYISLEYEKQTEFCKKI